MEDSGYMARAAFIMDKIMHRFGLHGRSFIPLVMGFGCNVPAIMATRTLRSPGDRLLTMLIIPFMSCSARLPVYVLFISAFFPNNPGLVLAGIYFLGILIAFLMAQILNKTIFRNKETPFVMELPTYRMPTLKNISVHMWDKAQQYLKKIGGVILIGVIIIWAMGYFPREVAPERIDHFLEEQKMHYSDFENDNEAREHAEELLRLQNSYLGRIGQFIVPVMEPLGFDWKMSVAILAGLPAKEIIVSTMGVLYQTGGDEENTANLATKLQNETYLDGPKRNTAVFSVPVALAFLVFVLIYFPCIGVVATIRSESGKIRWALFAMFYTTALAWLFAYLVFHLASLLI